jgi:hypothetical protein
LKVYYDKTVIELKQNKISFKSPSEEEKEPIKIPEARIKTMH